MNLSSTSWVRLVRVTRSCTLCSTTASSFSLPAGVGCPHRVGDSERLTTLGHIATFNRVKSSTNQWHFPLFWSQNFNWQVRAPQGSWRKNMLQSGSQTQNVVISALIMAIYQLIKWTCWSNHNVFWSSQFLLVKCQTHTFSTSFGDLIRTAIENCPFIDDLRIRNGDFS